MPVINISVENKIAEADGTLYVCGNSDFVAKFAFDAEWEAYETKTARFGYNNSYVDVVFTGDKCPVPIISGTYFFNIGVYAGDLHTTTPARVPCKKSILCDTGFPADPPNDVYNQIMEKLNSLESADPEAIAKAVANYLAEHPVEETDPTVPEWAKAEITGAKVGQIAKITAVDTDGVPTAWSPVDMPTGGSGETWEEINVITLADAVNTATINTDSSGNALALKKVRILIEGSATRHQDLFLNNSRYFRGSVVGTAASVGALSAEPFCGKMYCFAVVNTTANYAAVNQPANIFSKEIIITEIKLIVNDAGTYSAGTKFTIQGVRA